MSKPTLYELLGVPPNAKSEEIRKQYRLRARQFHPDVNPAPDAKTKFIQIQEAYQILSDPERRKHYDAMLAIEAQRRAAMQRKPTTNPARASTTQPPKASPAPPPTAAQKQQQRVMEEEFNRLLLSAQKEFALSKMLNALKLAKQAQSIKPHHPKVHEIIGDVYKRQGQHDAALNAYTMALQFAPQDPTLQRKFNRLIHEMQRAYPQSPSERPAPARGVPASEWVKVAIQSVGWSAALFLIAVANLFPGAPSKALGALVPFLEGWSLNLIALLLLTGFLSGILLAGGGWIGAMEDALPWRSRQGRFSAGLGFLICAAFCFPVAAAAYGLLGVLQQAFNRSLNITFGCVGALTVGFALFYPHAFGATLLFGGNLLFLSLLGGWFLADATRTA